MPTSPSVTMSHYQELQMRIARCLFFYHMKKIDLKNYIPENYTILNPKKWWLVDRSFSFSFRGGHVFGGFQPFVRFRGRIGWGIRKDQVAAMGMKTGKRAASTMAHWHLLEVAGAKDKKMYKLCLFF